MCIVCVLENSMSPLFGRRVARRACVAMFVAVAGVVVGPENVVFVYKCIEREYNSCTPKKAGESPSVTRRARASLAIR